MSKWSSQPQRGAQLGQTMAIAWAQQGGHPSNLLSLLIWLNNLTDALQQSRAAGAESAHGWESGQQDEVMKMILVALLGHLVPCEQAAAAEACGKAVHTFPLVEICFLPLLMYKLGRSDADEVQGMTCTLKHDMYSTQTSCQGIMFGAGKIEHIQVHLALVKAIFCMVMHQTALPFVQRPLLSFSQPGIAYLPTDPKGTACLPWCARQL